MRLMYSIVLPPRGRVSQSVAVPPPCFLFPSNMNPTTDIPYLLVQEENPGVYKLIRTESADLPKDASVRQLLDDAHPKACSVIGGDSPPVLTLQVYTAR